MCTLCGLHTTTFSAGLPIGCFAVDAGRVGIPSTTFYRRGFVALIATVYCTWLVPISLITGIRRIGSLTLLVNRYLSIVESSIEEDIPHKLKLIVRQYETNCLAAVEDMQSYTSVELTIIQLDSTACPSARPCR